MNYGKRLSKWTCLRIFPEQSFQLGERNRHTDIREQVPYISQRVALPHGLFDVTDQKFRDFPACLARLFHRQATEFFSGRPLSVPLCSVDLLP